MSKTETAVSTAQNDQTHSERFTNMVIKQFTGNAGEVALTNFQKRLVQNYFISIDLSLKSAEIKRMKKSEQYRDALSISWNNINMETLALRVVACARIGFDPALPNHINMMPFKNNDLNKYDIVFVEGYRGKELKATKYGHNVPDDVVVEVVFKNDVFIPIKKDKNNTTECYVFEVKDPFNRGAIVGGFYYHVYNDKPYKNKLMFYSINEIEKRKPAYASSEFWGGEKDVWKNGKKVGTEHTDGWHTEMVWKTIYRAAYNAITIDSQKIDDDFIKLSENEGQLGLVKPENALDNANKIDIHFDDAEVVDSDPDIKKYPATKEESYSGNPEPTPQPTPEPKSEEPKSDEPKSELDF